VKREWKKKALILSHIRSIETLIKDAPKQYWGEFPNSFKEDIYRMREILLDLEKRVDCLEAKF